MATKRTSGIYAIINTITGKTYIGQSINIEARWREHRSALKYGRHGNPHLQHAWNAYGPESFTMSVLEVVEPENLNGREAFWINDRSALSKALGFNCRMGGDCGGPIGQESRLRMSEAARRRGRPSEETRKRMSAAGLQRAPATEETRRKLSAALMGHAVAPETVEKWMATRRAGDNWVVSDETRQKQARASTGRLKSDEERRKLSALRKGKTLSAETRQKLSAAAKLRFSCADERRKTSEATRRAMQDPAVRERVSVGKRGKESPLARAHRERLCARPVSDETRQKMSAAHKAYWQKKRSAAPADS